MPETLYPDWKAGDDITADLLRGGLPRFAYKTAQTDRASTVTPTDDPDLQMTLDIGSYHVEFFIHYSTPAAADFRSDWNFTGTVSSTNKAALGLGTTVTDSTPQGIMRSGIHGIATDITYGDRAGANQIFCYETGLVVVTASGLLSYRWAQGTSNAGTTSVHAESRMKVQRIA